jgi:hypothetical protein
LIDADSRVILAVEATPARFRQETIAAYKQSQRARYKIEALFAELKQQMRLHRVRLRRTRNVTEQFLLAAAAQNLKRMVRFLAQREAPELSTASEVRQNRGRKSEREKSNLIHRNAYESSLRVSFSTASSVSDQSNSQK